MQPMLEREIDWFEKPTPVGWCCSAAPSRAFPRSRSVPIYAVIAGRIDQLTPGRKTTLQIQTGTFLSMPEARTEWPEWERCFWRALEWYC